MLCGFDISCLDTCLPPPVLPHSERSSLLATVPMNRMDRAPGTVSAEFPAERASVLAPLTQIENTNNP